MKRAGLVAAVVVLATVAAWLILDREGGAGSLRAPGGRPSQLAHDAPATRAPGPLPGAIVPVIAPRPASEPEEAIETRAASQPRLLRVFVVDHAGAAVAGAEVDAIDESQAGTPRRLVSNVGGSSVGPPALPSFEGADRTISDAAGMAFVQSRDGLVLRATHGDLFGMRRFAKAPRGEVRLHVVRSFPIAARVVSEAGVPAPDVPVVMRRVYDLPGLAGVHEQTTVVTRAPDGVAVMRMWSELDAAPALVRAGEPQVAKNDRLEAWVEGYDVHKAHARFEDLRSGPLTLKLPLVGSMRVAVLNAQGEPFRDAARIYVGPGPRPPPEQAADLVPSPSVQMDAVDGVAWFKYVPVGLALSVVGIAEECEPVVVEVAPLGSTSEVVAVGLRFDRPRAVLAGRLVDESGRPLRSQPFSAAHVTKRRATDVSGAPALAPERSKPVALSTDSRGEFRIPAPLRAVAKRGGLRLEIEVEGAHGAVVRMGAREVGALAEAAETLLGDFEVAPAPVLVAGKVSDDLGEPLAGAAVVAALPAAWGMATARATSDHSGAFSISKPAAFSGTSGRLLVRRVVASLEGYAQLSQITKCEPGQADLVIVLHATGTVEGRASLAGGGWPARTKVTLSGPHLRFPMEFSDCVDSDGRFRLADVPAGVVNLEITRSGRPEPVAVLENISVPRHGVASDPRLQSIELPR